MGELNITKLSGSTAQLSYSKQLLTDVEALEAMIENGMFENDTIRIGAEQEFCLVNKKWEPSNKALQILEALDDDHFTTEIALYNLEANLDPLQLSEDCFSKMHLQLNELLSRARSEAAKKELKIILTGILPTIDSRHLKTSYMTPVERYKVLNDIICELRGEDLKLHIKGVDEINLRHDSILFEGCNTSFQGHLQLEAEDFANSYNWAQAIAGPLLSIAANSPLLMGRELWQESRIALFTQSIDTRATTHLPTEHDARVRFGNDWVQGSIVDYYRDAIVNFKSLITGNQKTDSLMELSTGKVPKLKALQLHNGTVYTWNRLVYGVTKGKPHVRIENRYLPAGPTTADEIANFMFWVGLMCGRPSRYDDIHLSMDFKDAKSNFYNAARYGSAAQFYWNGALITSRDLFFNELLPLAYSGLYRMKVKPEDVEKYLGILENRVKGKNGARWMVESFRKLRRTHKTSDALRMLTASMYEQEQKGYTIDAWRLAHDYDRGSERNEKTVRHYMNTKIITAQQNDSAVLVLKMMQWKNIHHMPIVNDQFDLVGLITCTDVKKYLHHPKEFQVCIKDVMRAKVITTTPTTAILDAERMMQEHQINCLPVVEGKKLMGIITNTDL